MASAFREEDTYIGTDISKRICTLVTLKEDVTSRQMYGSDVTRHNIAQVTTRDGTFDRQKGRVLAEY